MNATMTTALRTIALVIIVLVAATAGLVVGQLMQGRDTRETAAAAAGRSTASDTGTWSRPSHPRPRSRPSDTGI